MINLFSKQIQIVQALIKVDNVYKLKTIYKNTMMDLQKIVLSSVLALLDFGISVMQTDTINRYKYNNRYKCIIYWRAPINVENFRENIFKKAVHKNMNGHISELCFMFQYKFIFVISFVM